jgi:hypothetical protein
VKVLMTNHALGERAGSESYLETVAAELRGLGHEVVFFSTRPGEMAARLRDQHYDVRTELADVPTDVDVIHGQHVDTVGLVRTRLPRTPLVFVTHSWVISLEDPLAELGAGAFVALNDATLRRLEAHEATRGREVLRLTQPVTISFADGARIPLGPAPRRALAVSRRMRYLPSRLAAACAAAGLEFDWLGGPGRQSADAREEMRTHDIVFAVGRTALEAMAMGRAVFVVDDTSQGGWVRTATHRSLEADGLTGFGASDPPEPLETALASYDPILGQEARSLAVHHHAAQHHAAALVALYLRVADSPGAATPAPGLELLAAQRFELEARAVRAEWKLAEESRRVAELETELASVSRRRDQLRRQRDRARRALDSARGVAAD